MEQPWHNLSVDEVIDTLETDREQGLEESEVESRLDQYGFNRIPDPPSKSPIKVFMSQFNDILIYILIVAALATLLLALVESGAQATLEYYFDTVVIVAVLLINAIIGFYQEIKAEKAVKSLQAMSIGLSTVIRDESIKEIESKNLVPGDIVVFNAGEKLPADLRLVDTTNLRINESPLTGESVPVSKTATKQFDENTMLGDRRNMAFMGTVITSGQGTGVVVNTGHYTEVGKISQMVADIGDTKTPLQLKLENFSHKLAKIIIAIGLFLIIFGSSVEYLANPDSFEPLTAILGLSIVSVSLAVAAIPEGLPIILTFALAVSVSKMANQNAIIRKLQAVETLGTVTFIATDKTGTLTQNKLTLTELVPATERRRDDGPVVDKMTKIMEAVTLRLDKMEDPDSMTGVDPLDAAIYNWIIENDIPSSDDQTLLQEIPFDADRKMMSAIVEASQERLLATKGAPDVVLDRSGSILDQNGSIEPMQDNYYRQLQQTIEELAEEGYRIIGLAYRILPAEEEITDDAFEKLEQDLVFAGFLTFIDPPREEVYEALNRCFQSGIEVAMITGDHPQTALNIATSLGIVKKSTNQEVITGKELDTMSNDDLLDRLDTTRVFARVTPQHKLRLVRLLKSQDHHIVAMTGDGINDAPALVQADIGIAMGFAGTDAAKEASDMVLADDNFATIVDAVEEGRTVSQNIRKFTNYLLASNSSEVFLLMLGFFIIAIINPELISELIPLSETQILYLNLITDSFLAIALGLEPGEKDTMKKPPTQPNRPIIGWKEISRIMMIGILTSFVTFAFFLVKLGDPSHWANLSHDYVIYAQSFTLTMIVMIEVFIAVSYRSKDKIWNIGFFKNRFFFISVLFVFVAHLAILYVPLLNRLFDTAPISLIDWLIILSMAIISFLFFEFSKTKE